MPRKAQHRPDDVDKASALARAATNLAQLRQAQAVLIPALLGADLATTAQILGLGRARVSALRGRFRAASPVAAGTSSGRGGRRHALLSPEDERKLVKSCLDATHSLGLSPAVLLRSRLDSLLGKVVTPSTVYRMLARHGWYRGTRAR
jgi:hypothetical protein